jgi:UTP--glucose-1-phosphate uridylyltransferase
MDILANTPAGKGGEIQLTDALVQLLEREEIYAVIVDPEDGRDTGNALAWLEANIVLALADERYGSALEGFLQGLFHPERAQD